MQASIRTTLLTLAILICAGKLSAQPTGLETIARKYEPFYESVNAQMGILIKKGGSMETTGVNYPSDVADVVFNIGSATKTFTSVLILQEMERGNLSLTDGLGKFLDPIHNVDPAITIEQLLRHQSGLGEVVGRETWDAYNIPHDSILRRDFLADIPPMNTAMVGKFRYTNTNYLLLGRILEKINDVSYFELLKTRIFIPCGLQHTYPYLSRGIPNLLHPTDEAQEQDVFEGINYKYFADFCYAAGSIASTLADMATFYHHLYETETFISRETFNQMIDFKGGTYGLGIERLDEDGESKRFIGHGGNNYGYMFRNYYCPETGEMALYFVNRVRNVLKNALIEDLLAYLDDRPIAAFPPANGLATAYSDLLGEYSLEGVGMTFRLKGDQGLIFLVADGMRAPLMESGEGVLSDFTSGITLTKDVSEPSRLVFKQGGHTLHANRRE
ncbi:serine hydrolase domain-containing protein [Olivibacter sitiensis]|uniref:serine hydrolase domain-containing protein n=1 Tax=Olivibacter sitiensis TaxID=376470 RepID=UPI0003FE8FAB|nr:serine hydrolase domain-containing protein [Olivibacter sitiensis]